MSHRSHSSNFFYFLLLSCFPKTFPFLNLSDSFHINVFNGILTLEHNASVLLTNILFYSTKEQILGFETHHVIYHHLMYVFVKRISQFVGLGCVYGP